MAAFASCRRSGWVRLLVVILCALFIFATLAVPPAQALGVESVAVFGLASVLSAATAALGFKLASNEQGQATLQKMVQDFKTVAWATGFVLVGSKLNGLQNGMDYIKMQVKEGKTYLDARVFAWVQQWLAQNGVYNSSASIDSNIDVSSSGGLVSTLPRLNYSEFYFICQSYYTEQDIAKFNEIITSNSLDLTLYPIVEFFRFVNGNRTRYYYIFVASPDSTYTVDYHWASNRMLAVSLNRYGLDSGSPGSIYSEYVYSGLYENLNTNPGYEDLGTAIISNVGNYVSGNDTGLSGTDTLGKDVIDLTLDQVLQKLKEWAQDWFDAGADSATNAATGALDLPLTVATGAATANPSIAEDGPLVWFPPFSVPIPNLRTGETDTKTVDQGKENASAAETSTVDVAENQSVIDSLVNWALNYISPDTGLFSKFPLCVPYDAYLLVTSSLGVNAVGSDSIFGASPGDLEGVVSQDIETYSDFQPIINIKHDFQLDGATYPIELTIDLTPWQPLVTFFREGMALLLVAELIGAEFKRIRGH